MQSKSFATDAQCKIKASCSEKHKTFLAVISTGYSYPQKSENYIVPQKKTYSKSQYVTLVIESNKEKHSIQYAKQTV